MAEALDEEQGIKMEVYSDLPEVSVSKSQFLLFSRHGSPFLMNYPSFPQIVQERLIAFVKAPSYASLLYGLLYIPAYTVECLYNQGNFTFKVNPPSFPFCSLLLYTSENI